MKKYKVIALSVGGKHNKIYHSGDIVTEDKFHDGEAPGLARKKFIEPIGHTLKDEAPEGAENKGEIKVDLREEKPFGKKVETDNENDFTIEDVDIKDLKAELSAKGIKFDKNATKEDLFDLWKKI